MLHNIYHPCYWYNSKIITYIIYHMKCWNYCITKCYDFKWSIFLKMLAIGFSKFSPILYVTWQKFMYFVEEIFIILSIIGETVWKNISTMHHCLTLHKCTYIIKVWSEKRIVGYSCDQLFNVVSKVNKISFWKLKRNGLWNYKVDCVQW